LSYRKYIHPAAYVALRKYVFQRQAYEADPINSPKADPALLLVYPEHGPIAGVELVDGPDGDPLVSVTFRGSIPTQPRRKDPLYYCAMSLGLACGGGASVQDNGKNGGYLRFRIARPKGRNIYAIRVWTGATPWQQVEQCSVSGERGDYHDLTRRNLSVRSVRKAWSEGKKSRVPRLGRPEFLEAAAYNYSRHHAKAKLVSSVEDHLSTIRLALELGDREHAIRLTPPAAEAAE
jgi:hypothetical protein